MEHTLYTALAMLLIKRNLIIFSFQQIFIRITNIDNFISKQIF